MRRDVVAINLLLLRSKAPSARSSLQLLVQQPTSITGRATYFNFWSSNLLQLLVQQAYFKYWSNGG